MNQHDFASIPQSVEYCFANLFNVNYTPGAFDDMLNAVKSDLNYDINDFSYDMRTGMLHLYTDLSEITEAPMSIQMAPKACALVASKKINLLKNHGLMDVFAQIILSDFCRIQSYQARAASKGYTAEMFNACLGNATFYHDKSDVDSRFVASVMMIALVSDTPKDVVKATGQCKGELSDFIRMTKRRDLISLLDAQHRRDFLADDLEL
jgi:hypothetical protein